MFYLKIIHICLIFLDKEYLWGFAHGLGTLTLSVAFR